MSSTTFAPGAGAPARDAPSVAARPSWLGRLLPVLRGLSYYTSAEAAGRRDLRVDFLRGFCVFAMVVDHLGGDSWLYAMTGGNRFYVSAAEGFIFISGLVLGQAYHSKVQRSGLVESMIEALRRARTLWLTTVAMTLIFSALYLYTDLNLWTGRDFSLGIDAWDEIVVGALTLHYTYHGTDILAMYALLLLAAPFALLMLAVGRWQYVLIPSWLWWAVYQVYPEQAALPWYIRHAENFPLGAWQVLFFTGVVLGFERQRVTRWLQRWRPLRVVLIALCTALMLIFLSLFLTAQSGETVSAPFGFFDTTPDALSDAFFKVALRPWRLVAFTAAAILLYTATTYLWKPIKFVTGWFFLPLGSHALYSFILHFFLILAAINVAPRLLLSDVREGHPDLVDTGIQIAVMLVLWAMVKRRVLFGVIPN